MPPKKPQATKANGKPKKEPPMSEAEQRSKQEQDHEPESSPRRKPEREVDDKASTDTVLAPDRTSKKRKLPSSKSTQPPAKAPRTGSRASSRTSANPTPHQLLVFLLSDASLPYCYPDDELSSTSKKATKSYSRTSPASLTPFAHLLTAALLSKPLSHTLGMRSTRTLLNAPFSLDTPQAIVQAGEKQVWEALEAARTQHRQKTAAYIFQMGELFEKESEMGNLKAVAAEEGVDGVSKWIKSNIKGMGPTGAEIFCRRVQCVEGWEGLYPYADPRALDALRELGLEVRSAEGLKQLIAEELDHSKTLKVSLDQFVGALDRAVGCALEGKIGDLKNEAAKA